ncbi:MAG: hypothetical protein IPK79_08965 [Vampirovibrionales bacterium]|nr:hypothetical protein [Vampirovibrionales bacterium]
MSRHYRAFKKRRADRDAWERQVDSLARQLCAPEELSDYFRRRKALREMGNSRRIRLFPVWRRHRERAQRIARLREKFPILRALPLWALAALARWL